MSQLHSSTTQRSRDVPDWGRIQTLYAFCRVRAIERIIKAGANSVSQRRDLATLEIMYAQARKQDDVLTGCAVSYFRTQAFRDARHPDFLGEWI